MFHRSLRKARPPNPTRATLKIYRRKERERGISSTRWTCCPWIARWETKCLHPPRWKRSVDAQYDENSQTPLASSSSASSKSQRKLNWSQRQAKHLSLGSKAGACRCEVSCACSAFAVAWLGPVWPRWVGGGGRIGQAWSGLGMLPPPPPPPAHFPCPPARPRARPPARPPPPRRARTPPIPRRRAEPFGAPKGWPPAPQLGAKQGRVFLPFDDV